MSTPDFEVGDSVAVREGVADPDSLVEIVGWQGRVWKIEEDPDGEPFVVIRWDSLTLKSMPEWYLEQSEQRGLGWSEFILKPADVEHADSRDTPREVEEVAAEIESRVFWLSMGEEGRRIQKVVYGLNNEMEEFDAWERYLKENLSFPFEAVVRDFEEKTPLRQGDRVRVWEISIVDDLYGVIIAGRWNGQGIDFPLGGLEAVDGGRNKQIVSDYAVWFANR